VSKLGLLALCGALLALAGCGALSQEAGEGLGAGSDWPSHGGGFDESGYSRLEQIDASNIGRLDDADDARDGVTGGLAALSPLAESPP
jgi:hypothetical protein